MVSRHVLLTQVPNLRRSEIEEMSDTNKVRLCQVFTTECEAGGRKKFMMRQPVYECRDSQIPDSICSFSNSYWAVAHPQ